MARRLTAALLLLGLALPSHAQPSKTAEAGMQAYNRGDHRRAFDLLRAAGDAGDAEALANLGYLFARGHGVLPNLAVSLGLYERAAASGSSEGMNAIGYRHQHGHGVLRDAHEAIQWYCLAIRAGNPRAMNNLAGMLASGDGIGRDLSEAIGLWEQSALLNHAHAMLNLGIALLQSGRDPVQGRLWLERAAMLGVVHAQAMLRRVGHAGPFPAPVDHGLLMKPAPQGVRGHTYVCDEPLTS